MPAHETKYIHLDSRKCEACWKCIESCPNGVMGRTSLPFHKHARIDRPEKCQGCQKCVNVCKEKAISILNKCTNSKN